jgi:hypothetical protein
MRSLARAAIGSCAVLGFFGCTASPSASTPRTRSWDAVRVYRGRDVPPARERSLGPLQLSACQEPFNPGSAQESVVLKGLRIQAARLGADAIINVVCEKTTKESSGCSAGVTCSGEAVTLK